MTTKRLIRGRTVPDDWNKVWPFGQKSEDYIRAVAARVEARRVAEQERQREYAREQARLIRRGIRY